MNTAVSEEGEKVENVEKVEEKLKKLKRSWRSWEEDNTTVSETVNMQHTNNTLPTHYQHTTSTLPAHYQQPPLLRTTVRHGHVLHANGIDFKFCFVRNFLFFLDRITDHFTAVQCFDRALIF